MGKWFQDKSFSTEKRGQGIKARKGHRGINARKIHRALGILLAAALVFQAVPFDGTAVSASESSRGGLCEHHRSHTAGCGYKEAEAGHECTHEHTEDCYRTVEGEDGSTTKELDCHHEHDESCGYREAAEGSPCTFVCEICNEGTDETPEDKTDGNEINDESFENPGTENGDEIKEPDDGQEDTSLCKHHPEHDDTCGCLPESEDSEGSPCTYECRICPVEELIAVLPDAADITEDNADEVRAQLEEILTLFAELTEDEQEQIDLSSCYALQETLDAEKAPVMAEEIPADAVAIIEKEGAETVYVTAGKLNDVFSNSSYAGATITLLANVKRTSTLYIGISCTLDLSGHTITCSGDCISVYDANANVTIRGEGKVISEENNALTMMGSVTLEGGTFIGNGENNCGVYVVTNDVALSVTGENVVIQNTKGYGLGINEAQSVQLSSGKYSGAKGAIAILNSLTLGDLLDHTGDTWYAYFDSTGTTPFTGKLAETELTGTVTVGVCKHIGDDIWQYTPMEDTDTLTHTKTCLACGKTETEDCEFSETAVPTADGHNGQCPDCKREQSGAHSFSDWTGNPVAKTCTVCGYEQVAVAKVVKGGTTTYVGNLDDAFKNENNDAIITLLADVTRTEYLPISIGCILDLGGHTISGNLSDYILVITGKDVTIQGDGGISGIGMAKVLQIGGNVTIKGGTFSCAYGNCIFVTGSNASLSITGSKVRVENTGGYGLFVNSDSSVQLSAGTYSGTSGAISIGNNASFTLGDLLDHSGDTRYAYFDSTGTTPFTGKLAEKSLAETAKVQECEHTGVGVCEYTHAIGTTTHQQTCLACGKKWDEENCSFGENGKCACEAVLAVALKENVELTYTGEAQTPAVTVTVDGTELAANNYTAIYTNNTNAGTAMVIVTGKTYTGKVTKEFNIQQATPTLAWESTTQELTYTGKEAMITAPKATGPNDIQLGITHDTGPCHFSYAALGDSTFTDGLPIDAGTYTIKASIEAKGNYTVAESTNTLTLTISYMQPPTSILYNGGAAKEWYNGDVKITADGYTVSDTLGGDYQNSYTISAQEGTVAKTLYFKEAANGHMSGGVEVTVKFDLTPPTGSISVGAKAWDRFLEAISFGHYKAKEYAVTIKAEDKNGSGIDRIEYVIVTGSSQYTETGALEAANLGWADYDSDKPAVPAEGQYVVYARLMDKAGNVTYISTDGILLDSTPPVVADLSVPGDTLKDVTAGFTFTVSEAADYYYVVLPKNSAAPSANDIIVTCGGTLPEDIGTAISGTFPKGSGAVSADSPGVSVDVKNLSPNTAYVVYVTAVDRAVDITDSAEGKLAGNIAEVVNAGFTTKKTLPTITEAPKVTGTYGQRVGEMTVTGGTAKDGNTVLAGTWTVSAADQDKKPSAGTAEKVTVTFTPDNGSFDSVSVEITPTVGRRSLSASGVTISEVAGSYTYTGSEIKPPVAVGTGTPASGISISDTGAALTTNDFTVSYSNNKDAGTASVTITGKGNYTGSVTRTFTIGKAPGRTIPDLAGSYTDNGQTYTYTITPTEGAVYRMGDDGAWQEENVFKEIKPGTSVTFYAKMPEDKNYEDGTPKSITVDFPKLTPAAPALSYQADRTNPADVKVTITPVSGAEYSFDGGKTWTDSNEQGGFTTSQTVVLAIRLKATATHNQSPEQTVAVNLAKKDREAPPAFTLSVEANGETDYTVTIPATEGCEYSFDGEHWSDVNVKTGVNVGETVTGYKRYKETDDYNASSVVSASKTMEKFTVKTPVISPAGGSYTGNVSVAITCASPDAEIYYTTDGSTPDRSSTRYTGAFTVTAPATVKAIAVKDGLTDSAVATASYTKKSSGSSGSGGSGGGDSGGNEDNGGQGSGGDGSTNPGNGSTTPQIPVTPPAQSTNPGNEATPGTGTTPVNPGNGNTVRPGSGAGTPAQGTKQPFIKGEDGKIGWDVIRAEEEKAEEGSVINVDMNGSVVVPGDIFDSIKGKDITITFDMGSGIIWSVDGKSITTDKAGDIDFSVKTGVNTVPVDIINNVTGESYSIQISLAYEGEFGFTAVLSINLGKENAGYTASLYYYNESTGELAFICSDEVAQDGTVSLAFTHASDYVIAIDGDGEEGDGAAEPVQPDGNDRTVGNGTAQDSGGIPGSPGTGQTGGGWWMIAILLFIAVIGAGIAIAVVREKRKGNS